MGSRAKGCVFGGCGCLVVVFLGGPLLLLGLGLAGKSIEPRPVERSTTQALPEDRPSPASEAVEGRSGQVAGPTEQGGVELVPQRLDGRAAGAGRIVLSLAPGELEVMPGEPGDPIRLYADYDEARFSVEESFSSGEDGSWVYELRSRSRRGILSYVTVGDDIENRLRLVLPPDRPFALVGKIGLGESELELGGLWLTEVDLELGLGAHRLRVSEPLVEPMSRLRLASGTGDLGVFGIGNASPSRTEVSHDLGELRIDLGGAWQNDGEIDVRFGMGGCVIHRAPGIDLKVVGDVSYGETSVAAPEAPVSADGPVLTLRVHGRVGELEVQ